MRIWKLHLFTVELHLAVVPMGYMQCNLSFTPFTESLFISQLKDPTFSFSPKIEGLDFILCLAHVPQDCEFHATTITSEVSCTAYSLLCCFSRRCQGDWSPLVGSGPANVMIHDSCSWRTNALSTDSPWAGSLE